MALQDKVKRFLSGAARGANEVFVQPLARSAQNIGTAATLLPQAGLATVASKFNPQLGAQIASPDIFGTQTRGQQIVNNPGQALGQQVADSTRLALSAYGMGAGVAPLASTAVIGGGLNAGIAGLTGQDPWEAAGYGAGSAPLYAGLNRFTEPLLGKALNTSFAGAPLRQKMVTRGFGQGLFNVLEDEGFTRLTEQRAPTTNERLLSFGVGAITSPLGGQGNLQGRQGAQSEIKLPGLDFLKRQKIDVSEVKKPVKVKKQPIFMSDLVETPQFQNKVSNIDFAENGPRLTRRDFSLGYGKQSAAGLIGGVETEQDEEGNYKMSYNPYKALAGVAVAGGVKSIRDKGTMQKIGDALPSVLKKIGGDRELKKLSEILPMKADGSVNRSALSARQLSHSNEELLEGARKRISFEKPDVKTSIKQSLDNFYTQWVDRYHPINKASQKAKATLKEKGAELRPEYDPEYLVRRLTGAGGIADYRFKTELEPVIKKADELNIDKKDLDVYLANKRIAGFGKVGRDIYGANPEEASRVITALEGKYGENIKSIADDLYKYQDDGLEEMVKAGFINADTAQGMRGQNPDYAPLKRVMDEVNDYIGLPTRKTMQGSQPLNRIKGSKRQIVSPIQSIIENTFSQRAAIEKNKVAQSIVGLSKIDKKLMFRQVKESASDTITVWKNGQKEYWRVGKDIADVAKGTNEEAMNLVLKLFQAPASLLRQGATGRNPEFMIPNIVRDQLDAGVASKYGYIPFFDYVSGLKSMLKNDDVYQKWQQSGAKIDLGELSGKKSIEKYVNDVQPKKNLFTWLGKGLDVMGKYSEQPTRVGLFKKAYQKTGNELLSAMESRDATVDFARMGSKMKVANSIIPFLNVGVQGFDKLIRASKNNPGKVSLMLGLYAAAPQVATSVYNLTNFPEEYNEIPNYEKESNLILIQGRNEDGTVNYSTIPKGNIAPVVANPIQSFLEYAYGSDKASFKEMALSTLSSTLPVVGDGSSGGEIALKTVGGLVPQAFKPISENLLNKSFYKYDAKKEQTKDIVSPYLMNKPAYQRSYEWTPSLYKGIGAIANVSPLQVQNLMEGYLAGYSKIPAQLIDIATNLSKNEEVSRNDRTFLRRFFKTTIPATTQKPIAKPETPGFMERISGKASAAESLPENVDDLEALYKDAQSTMNKYKTNSAKIRTGLKNNQTLQEAQTELVEAKNLMNQIKEEKPEEFYQIELSHYKNAKISEKGDWAYNQIKDLKGEELNKKVADLWEEGILTGKSNGVAQYIKDKYKVSVFKTGTGSSSKKLKLDFSDAIKALNTKPSVKIKAPVVSSAGLPNIKRLRTPKSSNLRYKGREFKLKK